MCGVCAGCAPSKLLPSATPGAAQSCMLLPPSCLQYHWYNGDVSRSMLASSSSTDDDEAAAAAAAVKYSSFDDGDGSFLAALRQSKRKSIRQARFGLPGCASHTAAMPGWRWRVRLRFVVWAVVL